MAARHLFWVKILGDTMEVMNSSILRFCIKQWHSSGSTYIDATLGSGNLRELVRLPPCKDFNEWIATHISWSYGVERFSRFPLKLLEARNVQMTAL